MTAKEAVQEILNNTEPDASFEAIMYSIYVREKIERGLNDVNSGHLASEEEVAAVLGKWETK